MPRPLAGVPPPRPSRGPPLKGTRRAAPYVRGGAQEGEKNGRCSWTTPEKSRFDKSASRRLPNVEKARGKACVRQAKQRRCTAHRPPVAGAGTRRAILTRRFLALTQQRQRNSLQLTSALTVSSSGGYPDSREGTLYKRILSCS